MSRHLVEVVGPQGTIHVVVGWDRPLGEFFIQLWVKEDDEAPLACSLDAPALDWCRADTLVGWLAERGLALPAPILAAVVEDAAHNVGNRVVVHASAKEN